MAIITFGIDSQTFNQHLKEEMAQNLQYCGRSYSLFHYVLEARVGRLRGVKEWYEKDGFYCYEASFYASKILDKIKQLTLSEEIFRGCKVDLYMKTYDKFGYYQVDNGFTETGFSIKEEKFFLDKLIMDFHQMEGVMDTFKINLHESVGVPGEVYRDRDLGRKVYSFFVNKAGYDKKRLSDAIETFELKQYQPAY